MIFNGITLKNISKSFGSDLNKTDALKNCSLKIEPGETVGIYGSSGAGKSTLLNILGLAESPTSGEFNFNGKVLNFSDEKTLIEIRRKYLGYLFQYFNLIPAMSAVENAILPLVLNQINWNEAIERASDLLSKVGLGSRINHIAGTLSGGEMQRVGLVRAIIHKPSLVLADEPTGNLDSKNGQKVLELLYEYLPSNSSIVIVSHSQDVLDGCKRLIHLKDGEIVLGENV